MIDDLWRVFIKAIYLKNNPKPNLYKKILFLCLFLFLVNNSLFSQFYFGRNKVQYNQFDWQILSTKHFNIYYYKEADQLAEDAAFQAEKFFDILEQKFNHTIDRKIPLIIYSNHIHFQQTNVLLALIPEGVGGFFEFIKQRVVVPFNGSLSDFHRVINHELVHVFMHNKIGEKARDVGLFEMPGTPLWFVEGLAELWSQGWSSQSEMIVRDAVLYDYLYPLDSFEMFSSGFLLYKAGQSFLRYYQEVYGQDRLRAIMEDFWKYESFEETVTAVSGRKYKHIISDWKIELKKEYGQSLASQEILSEGKEKLTKHRISVSPCYFLDKNNTKHVLYLTNKNGYSDICDYNLRENKKQIIVKSGRKSNVQSLHLLQSGISVNQDGQLAFVTKSGANDVIRIVDIKTKKEITSLFQEQLVTIRSPKWSPKKNEIIFSAQDKSGKMDIFLWNINQSTSIRLTKDFFSDQEPCFSPDGKKIVFSSDRGKNLVNEKFNLFLMDLESKKIYTILEDNFLNIKPFWSLTNQDKIYFVSDRSGTPNVYYISLLDQDKIESTSLNLSQVTNLHNGIEDIFPRENDSLIVSAFNAYSFGLYNIKTRPKKLSLSKKLQISKTPSLLCQTGKISRHKTENIKAPYKIKYTFDFAQTMVSYDPIFGSLGGAQLGISDILGNRYFHFLVANTASMRSEIMDRFNLASTFVDLTSRTNKSIGIFRFANDYYNYFQGFYYERATGIRSAINYPIDAFRRLEFSMTCWYSEKNWYSDYWKRSYLTSNYFSYVHDNCIWNYCGPVDGWRLRITMGPTYDFKRAKYHNFTGLLDFRTYFRYFGKFTWAHRSFGWINKGEDIRGRYIGGSWGMRGYRLMQLYGNSVLMFNNELRFQVARKLFLQFKNNSFGLAPINGAFFIDVGNAWKDEYTGMLGSFGFGLRGVVLGGFVLRLDFGKKTDFHSIQKGIFTQFFFGWDY